MRPYYQDDLVTIYHGDCLDVLTEIRDVDCIVTSPPYNTLGSRVPASPTGMHTGSGWLRKITANGYADDLSEADYEAWQIRTAEALGGGFTARSVDVLQP